MRALVLPRQSGQALVLPRQLAVVWEKTWLEAMARDSC